MKAGAGTRVGQDRRRVTCHLCGHKRPDVMLSEKLNPRNLRPESASVCKPCRVADPAWRIKLFERGYPPDVLDRGRVTGRSGI